MSEEIKAADGLLQRIAELEAALDTAETARKAWTEVGAKAQADAAALRVALTLAIEMIGTDMYYVPAAIEAQIRAPLIAEHPGAVLLAELEAARALADILMQRLNMWGGCPICYAATGTAHTDGCALAAYNRAAGREGQKE